MEQFSLLLYTTPERRDVSARDPASCNRSQVPEGTTTQHAKRKTLTRSIPERTEQDASSHDRDKEILTSQTMEQALSSHSFGSPSPLRRQLTAKASTTPAHTRQRP